MRRIFLAVPAAVGLALLSAGCPGEPAEDSSPGSGAAEPDAGHPDADASAGGGGGDAGGGGAADGGSAPHQYECVTVGSGYSDGFFALRGFQGALYAGQFGYGHESQSMLYRYPPWELVQPGLTGISESVCALIELDGWLYANTESSGDIFRSADGESWQRVYDGPPSSIGCALEVFGGQLYAVNYDVQAQENGRVLRSANGTDWQIVWDSGAEPWYLRELAAHAGVLHAFAVDEGTLQGYRLSSANGTDWSSHPTPSRFFRAHSWQGSLWIGSTERSSNGVAGVWQFDGSGATLVQEVEKRYVTELTDWDQALWAGTSDGWKTHQGTSSLLMSRDGASWQTVCEFSEIAAWSIAAAGEHLYVGTWQYGDGGQVYEVRIDDDPEPEVDCSLISAENPAWEVCETGPSTCAGVFGDGAGCVAYCAAAGLVCQARYGGEPGCIKEPANPLDCFEDNGHQSDWCECGVP